jgi:hypothetical protein
VSVTQDDQTLAATSYEFEAETGLLWRLTDTDGDPASAASQARVHWSGTTITVVYRGGYDVPRKTPYQLEQACVTLISYREEARKRDRNQRGRTIPGVIEEQWWNGNPGEGGMPPDVADLIKDFRDYNAA